MTPMHLHPSIAGRRPEALFEPFERKPYDIFFLDVEGRRYVGRKVEAEVRQGVTLLMMKCCVVQAPMLLGTFERDQITEEGVVVFHRPLEPAEKREVFASFVADTRNEIHYPFTHLGADTRKERCSSHDYWTPTRGRALELDSGEVMLRKETEALLAKLALHDGALVYDPACSTGAFLASVKRVCPGVRTVGQDLSPAMVEYARPRLDEVHLGDAWDSPLPPESADLVFVRLLNVDVVPTRRAYDLFLRIAQRCKDGGRIVVLGHTPVLVASAWFERLGFDVEQRSAATEDRTGAFQFYVLRRSGPLPEDASLFAADAHPPSSFLAPK